MRAKRIFVVIAYDISHNRKRKKVADLLENYGIRINLSVFECMLSKSKLAQLQSKIEKLIDITKDTVVYYTICVDCFTKIEYLPNKKRERPQVIVT